MLELIGGVLLFFLILFVLAVWLGVRLIRKIVRTARGFAAGFAGAVPAVPALADQRWRALSRHLDRRQQAEARIAYERISLLLAERGSAALTPDEAQLMIACEKRVPELIDACLDRCRSARPEERCDYAAPTLERLVRIGEEADALRRGIRGRDDGRLVTMHNYFDTVTSRR